MLDWAALFGGGETETARGSGQRAASASLGARAKLARARECKALMKRRRADRAQADAVAATIELVRHSSVLRIRGGVRHARLTVAGHAARTSAKKRKRAALARIGENTADLTLGYHQSGSLKRRKLCTSSNTAVPPVLAVAVASSTIIRPGDVAAAFSVKRTTVTRIRAAASLALLRDQVATLRRWAERLNDCSLELFSDILLWDETKQRVSVKIHAALSTSQQSSAWDILISRRIFLFTFVNAKGQRLQAGVEMLCPPIALVGTSAGAIYDGLFEHPLMTELSELASFFESKSARCFKHRSFDSAGSNVRLQRFEELVSKSRSTFFASWRCAIHQSHLLASSLLQAVGLRIASSLYSASLILRTGGHFLRVVLMTRSFVEDHAVRLPSEAQHSDKALCRYVMELCDDGHGDGDSRGSDRVAEFLAIFNGGFQAWKRPSLAHFCSGTTCCRDFGHTKDRMAAAIVETILRKRPAVPTLSRWTRMAPSLHFFLKGVLPHDIFPRLLSLGMKPLEASLKEESDDARDDLLWSAASGKRLAEAHDFFGRSTTPFDLLLTAVLLKPTFTLTCWLLDRGRVSKEFAEPPLFDFPSRVTSQMQEFSALLDKSALSWNVWALTATEHGGRDGERERS
jgi:hypothetical protein